MGYGNLWFLFPVKERAKEAVLLSFILKQIYFHCMSEGLMLILKTQILQCSVAMHLR